MAAEGRLLSLVNRATQSEILVDVRFDEERQCRGLFTTRDCAEGDALLCVPWQYTLTVQSAVRRLTHLERQKQPLTQLSVAELLQLCTAGDSLALVPRGAGWSLLLALQLLAELRDKRSPHAPYVATLPVPACSALSALNASAPQAGTHLSLSTPAQLECLDCPALVRAVLVERERLRHLHELLFGSESSVSFTSFAWANALVASRAVGLCIDADSPSMRCLLPAIDLVNHSDRREATASLRLRAANADVTEPAAVELFAARDLHAGTAVVFDYGAHQLREWAWAYGFVPPAKYAHVEETFETFSLSGCTAREQMHITAAGSAALRLQSVNFTSNCCISYEVSCSDLLTATQCKWEDVDGCLHSVPLSAGTEARLSKLLGDHALAIAEQMKSQEAHLNMCACVADAAAADEGLSPIAHLASAFRSARRRLLLHAGDGLLAHATLLR